MTVPKVFYSFMRIIVTVMTFGRLSSNSTYKVRLGRQSTLLLLLSKKWTNKQNSPQLPMRFFISDSFLILFTDFRLLSPISLFLFHESVISY